VSAGGNAVEINTEADRNDMTECPRDDQLTIGMFFILHSVFKEKSFCTLFTCLVFIAHLPCISATAASAVIVRPSVHLSVTLTSSQI